jgi:hypothetical protein
MAADIAEFKAGAAEYYRWAQDQGNEWYPKDIQYKQDELDILLAGQTIQEYIQAAQEEAVAQLTAIREIMQQYFSSFTDWVDNPAQADIADIKGILSLGNNPFPEKVNGQTNPWQDWWAEWHTKAKQDTITADQAEAWLTQLLGSSFNPIKANSGNKNWEAWYQWWQQFNIPAMADGGYVTKPTLALIGEAGNEWVVPDKNVTRSGAGKQGDVNFHITVPVAVTASEGASAQEIATETVRAAKTAIKDTLKYDPDIRRIVAEIRN